MFRLALLLGALSSSIAGAQSASPDEQAIREAIERHYFAAHATGNGSNLQGWFIPEGRMMFVTDSGLRVVPSDTYIGGFRGTPQPDEAQRRRRVLLVDVTGNAAMAKVELDYPTARFIDYFQLLKLDGEWKLVNKIFHRVPKPQ
jgi:hypothetical protein